MACDAEAARSLDEAGLPGRAERHIVDIAATPSDVDGADVVVLHRVVCCYPTSLGCSAPRQATHAGKSCSATHAATSCRGLSSPGRT
jgi:magnesium-protoporphyrin O-methyltransferase